MGMLVYTIIYRTGYILQATDTMLHNHSQHMLVDIWYKIYYPLRVS